MSTRSKGNRREREAVQILEDAGWEVHKKVNNTYDSGDILGEFDLLALRSGKRPLFIQVKSNTTQGALKSISEATFVDRDFINAQVWVMHDRKGWRIQRLDSDGWEVTVDERDKSSNVGERVIELYSE